MTISHKKKIQFTIFLLKVENRNNINKNIGHDIGKTGSYVSQGGLSAAAVIQTTSVS